MSLSDVEAFGRKHSLTTLEDDWQRLLCPNAGVFGHRSCGICPEHGVPRFRGHPRMSDHRSCFWSAIAIFRPTP